MSTSIVDNAMINVLIADDRDFVRKILEEYLTPESDIKVVGFAENGQIAIDKVASLKPDVVLMDIEMPVMDGWTATKTIAEKFEDTKVLILSIHDREQDLLRALRLGARGYCLKNTTARELVDAIEYVHKGYIQIAVELIEKHFCNPQKTSLAAQYNSKSDNESGIANQTLTKIEPRTDVLKKTAPQVFAETVERVIKQQMGTKVERDDNLQFRFDRLRHQLNRLERITSLTLKTQLICNLVLIAVVVAFGYFSFR